MPSLLDIAPPEISAEEIDIRGTKLAVRALGARDIATLFKRFPVMARQAAKAEVDPGDALISSIEAAPAIIAAALDCLGDAATEELVEKRLSAEEKRDVLAVVMRLTGPDSDPLALPVGNAAGPAGPGKEPDTSSPSPSTS